MPRTDTRSCIGKTTCLLSYVPEGNIDWEEGTGTERGISLRTHGPNADVSLKAYNSWTTLTYLDGLGIQLKTFLLVGQELLNILTLISLQLNHLAHLSVIHDGAIAGWGRLATF